MRVCVCVCVCVCTKMSSRKQCNIIQYRHLTLNIPPHEDRLCLIPPFMKIKVRAVTWSNNPEAKNNIFGVFQDGGLREGCVRESWSTKSLISFI